MLFHAETGGFMKLVGWMAIFAIAVADTGCNNFPEPTAVTQIGANLVRLTVSPSAREVVRGSPVTFTISLVNEGSESLTLHFSDSCQINPLIRNRLGDALLPPGGRWICATVLTQLTLLPGQPVVRTYVWTGGEAFNPREPVPSLPPGNYLFTAEVPAFEGKLSASVQISVK
jgi:hypothetical protein